MTDDELTLLIVLIATVALWLGYQINRWKIRDLEDRVERGWRGKMTNFDSMLELEEKVNKAAKECSNRLWDKKWNPGQDMLATAFIEGVKWLARESMKEQEK